MEWSLIKKLFLSVSLFLGSSWFFIEACEVSEHPVVIEGSSYSRVGESVKFRSIFQVNFSNPAGGVVNFSWFKSEPSNPYLYTTFVSSGSVSFSVGGSQFAPAVLEFIPASPLGLVNTGDTGNYVVRFSSPACGAGSFESFALWLGVRPAVTDISPIDPVSAPNPATAPRMQVSAQGDHLRYEWRRNGAVLNNGSNPGLGSFSGVQTNALTFNNFQLSQARSNYQVRVYNSYWTDNSVYEDGADRTAIVLSEQNNWTAHGICSGANNGVISRNYDPATDPLYVGEAMALIWENYQSGLGSCYTTVLGGANTAACSDSSRFGGDYFYFRSSTGSMDNAIRTNYRYEKQSGASWLPQESNFFSSSGAYEGPDFWRYSVTQSDSGNYRLALSSQPCAAAFNSTSLFFNVQVAPILLTDLTLSTPSGWYNSGPVEVFIGEYAQLNTYLEAGGSPNPPYTWTLQKWNGASWLDHVIETNSYSDSISITPYQNAAGVTGVRKPIDSGTYRIQLRDSTLPTNILVQTSNSIQINVIQRPVESVSIPSAIQVDDGNRFTFFASVQGGDAPYGFIWESCTAGFGCTPFSNNWTAVSGCGSSSATCQTPVLTLADNATRYFRVRAYSERVADAVSSGLTSVTVLPVAPSINMQPVSLNLAPGASGSLSVGAVGSPILRYQWRQNGVNLGGPSTSPFFNITNAQSSNAGQYDVIVSHTASAATVTSTSVTVSVSSSLPGPVITQQPAAEHAPLGGSASFNVSVDQPNEYSFQWMTETVAGSNSFVNLVNGGGVSGATTATLNLSAIQDHQFKKYQVRLTRNTQTINSVAVDLIQIPTLSITSDPSNLVAAEGSNRVFSVVAEGSELTYQWYKQNGAAWVELSNVTGRISGVREPDLSLMQISVSDAGTYRVRVTDISGAFLDRTATLTVNQAVSFSSHPASITRVASQSASFSVSATGTGPLSYQWKKDGIDLVNGPRVSGATTANLSLSSLTTADAGLYSVEVSNVVGSLLSNAASLFVEPAVAIATHPSPVSVQSGQPAIFFVLATGPSGGLNYQWEFRPPGGVFEPIPAAHLPTLWIMLTTSAHAGDYRVVVTHAASGSSATSNSASLTVLANPPSVQQPPQSQNAFVGSSVSFTVVASGEPAPTYQWFKGADPLVNSARISGASSAQLSLTSVELSDAGTYRVVVSNSAGSVFAEAQLTIQASACPVPSSPDLLTPVVGAVVSSSPSFHWSSVMSSGPGCEISYHLAIDRVTAGAPHCDTAPIFPANSNTYQYVESLTPNQNYFWCVRAIAGGQVASAWSAARQFQVESAGIPVPIIQIYPETSALAPSGQTEILVTLTGGEAFSEAKLFELRDTTQTLVGQRAYNSDGSASFVVELSDTSESRSFQYQAQTLRAGEAGALSLAAYYHFDPTLVLNAAPRLSHPEDVNRLTLSDSRMLISRVPQVTAYEVYRRIAFESCNPAEETCFNNTPFKRILEFNTLELPPSVQETAQGFIFTDSALDGRNPEPPMGEAGVSYFAVGLNNNSRTLRSNSVSFGDTQIIQIYRDADGNPISPTIEIRSLPDGRTIQVWAKDLPAAFALDNSADLVSSVLFREVQQQGDTIPSDFFDSNVNTVGRTVNALERLTVDSSIQNAILLSEHYGEPGKIYAHLICLKDVSNNEDLVLRANCFSPRVSPRLNDLVPPNFDGVGSVVAQNDGRSLKVHWEPATGFNPNDPQSSVTAEVIQYEIRYTDVFENSVPNFERGSFRIVEDPEQTSLVLEELKTGTPYAVSVVALDQSSNKTGDNKIWTVSTLDNRPYVTRAEFRMGAKPGEVLLSIYLQDRNFLMGDQVSLAHLKIGGSAQAMSVVDRIPERVRGASIQSLSTSGAESSRIQTRLDLSNVLTVELLAGFRYLIEVEDQAGNVGFLQGEATLVEGLALGANGFVSSGVGCARMTAVGGSHELSFLLSLFLGFLGLWIIRRRLA